MVPFQPKTFADGQMAYVNEFWLARSPALLSLASCWGIFKAILNTGFVFEERRHIVATSKRTRLGKIYIYESLK